MISLANLPAGSICVYSFHLGFNYSGKKTLAVYNFKVIGETKEAFTAAIVSNKDAKDPISGQVVAEFDLNRSKGKKSIEIEK